LALWLVVKNNHGVQARGKERDKRMEKALERKSVRWTQSERKKSLQKAPPYWATLPSQ